MATERTEQRVASGFIRCGLILCVIWGSCVSCDRAVSQDPNSVTYSATELAKVIDFTKLPKIQGTKVGRGGAAHLSAQLPANVPEVAAFYFDAFAKLGWKSNSAPDEQTPRGDYASGTLLKDGYAISLSIFKAGEPNTSSLDFIAHGNLDTSKLPRIAGAKQPYESRVSTIYFTATKVPAAADQVLKALVEDGWQPYDRLNVGKAAPSNEQRFLKLRKRGYALDVMIVVAPAQNNETSVQYNVTALSHELPTPPDAAHVEFDDNRYELKCTMPGDFKAAAEFYRKTMPEIGYKPLASEDPHETYWNLRFGADNGDVVVVQAASKDGKTTKILITGVPAAAVKKMNAGAGNPEKAESP
jgi:hypothetical protein